MVDEYSVCKNSSMFGGDGACNEQHTKGEFKHEVRQFEKSYDNQQAEQISLMV